MMKNKYSKAKPVLILDGDQGSALSIVRSLGRRGIHVDVGSCADKPLAGLSRFCSQRFYYPDPMKDMEGFRAVILERMQNVDYSLLIPVTDRSIEPLVDIRESIEKFCPVVMASREALETTLSKSLTDKLAEKIGAPIPKTVTLGKETQWKKAIAGFEYPLVIKSDHSKVWSEDGEGRIFYTEYAHDEKELTILMEEMLPYGRVVIQEYVIGDGVGIGALAWRGETLRTFQYRRLHEVPISGGGSSYRVSEPVDPVLEKHTVALLKEVSWDGVAMIEFKKNYKTGDVWLIEINGRFWGSLPLPVAAGVDFPHDIYELYVLGKRNFSQGYKVGLRCRDFAREIDWFKEAILRRPNDFALYPSYGRVCVDALRLINPLEKWDTLSLWDPKPGLAQILDVYKRYSQAFIRKIRERVARKRSAQLRKNPERLIEKLGKARSIQMVCHGNIIRSPFAAALLAHTLGEENNIEIKSSGMEAIDGRKAEHNSIVVAKEWGVDLENHIASRLSRDGVAEADLIFVAGIEQMIDMRRRFPEATDKTFMLTDLVPDMAQEVPDPVSQGETLFRASYEIIDKAVKPIAKAIAK